MTALIPECLEPLGIWDTRGVESAWERYMSEASDWAVRHMPAPFWIYRAEFYLFDTPFAVVHRYALGEDGMPRLDPESREAATEPPEIVPLAELPPAHLLSVW